MKDNTGLLLASGRLPPACLRPRRSLAVSGSARPSPPALSCVPSRSRDYHHCWRMCLVVANLIYTKGRWWSGGRDSTPLSQTGFVIATGHQESLRETRRGRRPPIKEPQWCPCPPRFHFGGASLQLPIFRPSGSPSCKFFQARESPFLLPHIPGIPSSKSVYFPMCYLHRQGGEAPQKSLERDGLESLFSSSAALKRNTHSHHTPVATSSPVREGRRDLVVFTGHATEGQATLASRNSLSLLSGKADVYPGYVTVGKPKGDTSQLAKVRMLSRAARGRAGSKLLSSHESSLEYSVRSFSFSTAFSFRRRDSCSGGKLPAALTFSRDGRRSLRHQQARRCRQEEERITQRRASYGDERKSGYMFCFVPGETPSRSFQVRSRLSCQ